MVKPERWRLKVVPRLLSVTGPTSEPGGRKGGRKGGGKEGKQVKIEMGRGWRVRLANW